MNDFAELSIAGRVATPDDSDWDAARGTWNLVADQHPSAVAFVETAGDIAKVIRFAGERGLKVAGQGTGHGAAALGPLDDTIVIKTERMRGIDVDAEAQRRASRPGCWRSSWAQPPGRPASARCPAPRPTWGSWATRSAAD